MIKSTKKPRKVKILYKVVDKLVKGDYIFIHYNGYIFKANDYPYNLRDGVASRDILTGEIIKAIPGEDTDDINKMPTVPTLQELFSRQMEKLNGQREENSRAV